MSGSMMMRLDEIGATERLRARIEGAIGAG
jgi:hypothetical protein